MASPKIIEARKLEAQQQVAADVAELNAKLDRLMAFLKVPAEVSAEEAKPAKAKKTAES
jgi:hypothetical protein